MLALVKAPLYGMALLLGVILLKLRSERILSFKIWFTLAALQTEQLEIKFQLEIMFMLDLMLS